MILRREIMFDILSYSFMQRALLIGIIISIITPTIGLFLVLRRLSMIGDTLSHVALAGVAFGLVSGVYPVYTAILFSLLASFTIEKLRKEFDKYAELSLSIVLAGGIGLATVLISLGKGKTSGIMGYLFGSISLVSPIDLMIVLILGIIIFASILVFYRALFYISFDEEAAKIAGVPVKFINVLFSTLVALTIALSMRIVGILLISSLMTLPVAASLQVAKSFKGALLYSNIFGVISVVTGLVISFYLDLAPGGTIVLTAIFLLIIVIFFKKITNIFIKQESIYNL